ncbi:hypothetical protein BJ912DRAFT_928948 [Pholiota molesta]|nr:hypothetical protein BJ912DRAFT_928948 [Pholiota molesta]
MSDKVGLQIQKSFQMDDDLQSCLPCMVDAMSFRSHLGLVENRRRTSLFCSGGYVCIVFLKIAVGNMACNKSSSDSSLLMLNLPNFSVTRSGVNMDQKHHDIQWTLVFVIGHVFMVTLTSWRLLYRCSQFRRLIWWDDGMSAVATLSSIVLFAHQCVSSQAISNKNQSIGYWMVMDARLITTWTMRLFLLLASIVLTMGIALFAIANYECAANLLWLTIAGSRCPTTKVTVMASFAESTIDIVLMFLLPKYVAEILKSPVHRRVVFAAFSGTAWILVVNTAFTIAYLHQPLLSRTVIIWLANLSTIVCVIQCNLTVITGIIYQKFFKKPSDDEHELPENLFS